MSDLPAEVECPKIVAAKRWRTQLWLLLLPVGFLLLYAIFLEARGPFWVRPTVDPDYAYLFNSLNCATGRAPHHTDHPGITLHAWGALVLRAAHPFSSAQALPEMVLREPERHLRWLSFSLAGIYCLCLLAAGACIWRQTGERWPALVLQGTPFFLPFFGATTRVSPEPVLLIIGLLVATLLYVDSRTDAKPPRVALALAFGALIATGIVTKLNFAPLAVVPLIALRNWKQRAIFLASVALFTLSWLAPLAGQMHRIIEWLLGLALHREIYGSGEPGVVPGNYGLNLMALLSKHPWMGLTLALSWAAALWPTRWGATRAPAAVSWKRLLGALVCGETLQIAVCAKYTQSRYLLPTLMLCPLNLLLLWHLTRLQWRERAWWHFARRTAALIGAIALAVITLDLRTQYHSLSRAATDRMEIARMTRERFNAEPVVLIGVASSPYYALWFGNFWAGAHYTSILRDRILQAHRPVYVVEGDNHIWLSGKRLFPLPDFAARQRSFILSGNARHERRIAAQLPAAAKLERLAHRGGEAIYRVRMDPAEAPR